MIFVNNKPLPPGEVTINNNRIFVDGKDFTPLTSDRKFKLAITYDPKGDNEIMSNGKVLCRLLPGQSIEFIVG